MAQVNEVHDAYGPYQIHVQHDGVPIVFIKNMGAYSLDSPRLKELVTKKIVEKEKEILKWKSLLSRMKIDETMNDNGTNET